MTIKTNIAYQPRKIVYIYLAENEEVSSLLDELKNQGKKVLLHLSTWQVWGEQAVREAYENKTHDYIIWPTQTSNSQKWAVLMISVKDKKAAIHTASKTSDSKKEQAEISNLLSDLKDFKISEHNPFIDTDDSPDDKDEIKSAYLAIWYVKEILKQIKGGTYNYELDAEEGEQTEDDNETAIEKIKKVYDGTLAEVKKLSTIKQLEDNQEKHGPSDLKPKDLPDDWEQQLKNVANEKYKKEDWDGNPWSLTGSEKARIDQAANKQDVEKVVRDIMNERVTAGKIDQWIKDNITGKTKIEDLPSEADIDNAAEIPSSAKEQVKWKLQAKKVELMPATTAQGKIKKHLTEVKFKWERWINLVKQKDATDPADYAIALMFAEGSEKDKTGFGKTVAQEMLPKIITAIAKDTIEDYRNLDKEWGQNLLEDDRAKYNEDRDYYEVWKTLREYLHEEKANKDEWMKVYLKGLHGNKKFEEVEKQYQEYQVQIEVQNNK